MRIMKTRLREMIPDLSIFLDVDALGNTRLKDFEHIDISDVVLVFLTQGDTQRHSMTRARQLG